MALPREDVNPLRPYYVPPSTGNSPNLTTNATSGPSLGNKHASTSPASFGSSARNILADLDYSDYISESSPPATDIVKKLIEQAIWKYISVFLAQPFEVAKMVLQVQVAGPKQTTSAKRVAEDETRRRQGHYHRDFYDSDDV